MRNKKDDVISYVILIIVLLIIIAIKVLRLLSKDSFLSLINDISNPEKRYEILAGGGILLSLGLVIYFIFAKKGGGRKLKNFSLAVTAAAGILMIIMLILTCIGTL